MAARGNPAVSLQKNMQRKSLTPYGKGQITRAMKFVAASKLRRAQERVFSARPYANRMLAVLNSLASRVEPAGHPLLELRDADGSLQVKYLSAE